MEAMTEELRNQREKEWLAAEVRMAANLTDRDRIRILRDLLEAAESIRRSKTPEDLRRDEEVRNALEREPGLRRYRALVERLQ
jgi:hypothetical protein